MGIVYNYLALTPALLEQAKANRELALSLVHRDWDDPEPAGVLARMDLDKAWDGAAYLLSAERRATDDLYLPSDPLARAVFGMEAVLGDGWFEAGHEPSILDPAEVRTIAAALQSVTRARLRVHFDHEAMKKADVYTAGADSDYFIRAGLALKEFYADAANAGAAVVIYRS